jgi:hypothetical protein
MLLKDVSLEIHLEKKSQGDDLKFNTNWRSKAAPGTERNFRNQYAHNRSAVGSSFGSSGFRQRDFSGIFNFNSDGDAKYVRKPNQFERRPSGASVASDVGVYSAGASAAPKPNPFGQAAPRDELAIQQAFEKRQMEREEKSIAKPHVDAPIKKGGPASGSWRKNAGSKPLGSAFANYKGRNNSQGESNSADNASKANGPFLRKEFPKRKHETSSSSVIDASGNE